MLAVAADRTGSNGSALNADEIMPDTLPKYADLQMALLAAGSIVPPSECHGIAVGQFCAAPRFDPTGWFHYIFDGELVDEPKMVHCATLLGRLARATDSQLKDDGVAIDLLLPDEEAPFSERAGAVAEWCQGFLLGVSMAQIGELRALPQDSSEFLQDVSAVARLVSESELESGENEEALAEVIEYVRIGALLLREEVLFRVGSRD